MMDVISNCHSALANLGHPPESDEAMIPAYRLHVVPACFQTSLVLVSLCFAAFAQGRPAQISTRPVRPNPRFDEFRVPTPLAPRGEPAFISRFGQQGLGKPVETDSQFEERVREAAKQGPDFAGHYAVVRSGCGSSCEQVHIVDVETGKTYHFPSAVVGGVYISDMLSYRLDSNLLVVTGSLETNDQNGSHDTPCGNYYYRWISQRMNLIRTVYFPCRIAYSMRPGDDIATWQSFTNRAGWSIKVPYAWRISSCVQCSDPSDPNVFVSFQKPGTEGLMMVDRLADKPDDQSADQWLKSADAATVLTPKIREQWTSLGGMRALRVIHGDSNSVPSEHTYVVRGSKTFAIRTSPDMISRIVYERMLVSFRFTLPE